MKTSIAASSCKHIYDIYMYMYLIFLQGNICVVYVLKTDVDYLCTRFHEMSFGFGNPSEKKCQSSLIFYCNIPRLRQSLGKSTQILMVTFDRTDNFRELWRTLIIVDNYKGTVLWPIDKVYQLLAHDRWFSPGNPASSTTKTGRHDIDEILLKVALNTINQIK